MTGTNILLLVKELDDNVLFASRNIPNLMVVKAEQCPFGRRPVSDGASSAKGTIAVVLSPNPKELAAARG